MAYTDSRICIQFIIAQPGLLKDVLLFYSANTSVIVTKDISEREGERDRKTEREIEKERERARDREKNIYKFKKYL